MKKALLFLGVCGVTFFLAKVLEYTLECLRPYRKIQIKARKA
jgi:hypothetical protein